MTFYIIQENAAWMLGNSPLRAPKSEVKLLTHLLVKAILPAQEDLEEDAKHRSSSQANDVTGLKNNIYYGMDLILTVTTGNLGGVRNVDRMVIRERCLLTQFSLHHDGPKHSLHHCRCCSGPPVDLPFRPPLTCEQDLKIPYLNSSTWSSLSSPT